MIMLIKYFEFSVLFGSIICGKESVLIFKGFYYEMIIKFGVFILGNVYSILDKYL